MCWVIAILVGCHGASPAPSPDATPLASSGFEQSRALSDLGPGEMVELCTWEVTTLGGPGFMHGCSECTGDACTDWNVTVNTVEQCVAQLHALAACGTTVGTDEACVLDQAADLCATPASCQPLDACL
jgi:hypothetical protein